MGRSAEDVLAALGESFMASFDDAEERRRDEAAAAARRRQREERAEEERRRREAKDAERRAAKAAKRKRLGEADARDGAGERRAGHMSAEQLRAERKALLSSDIDAIFSKPAAKADGGKAKANLGVDGQPLSEAAAFRAEFASLQKEVTELGASQLEGKAKKEYETRKLLALGARKEKGQKMPLRMLQGIRKKSAKREAAQRELERQAGIVTANTPKAGKRKKR